MPVMNTLLTNYHALVTTGNRFAAAGANALFVLLIIILIGFAVRLLTSAVTGLFAVLFGAAPAIVFCNYLTYPGVVHHELAHALFAFLTGAKVTRITLKPRGTTLGSVDFVPQGGAVRQAFEMTLSAIAPVICGLITLTLMRRLLFPALSVWWQFAIAYYLFICVFLHMDLSPQDIGVAAKGVPLFLAVLFVLFIFLRADLVAVLSQAFALLA